MTRDLLTGANFHGPIELSGSPGSPGQVPRSAGPGVPPVWGDVGVFNGYAAGNWISPVLGNIAQAQAHVANFLYLNPFIPQRSIFVNELGARVTSSVAGTSIQLAIYASWYGLPTGNPLAATGSLSSAAAAIVSSTVPLFYLNAGQVYWMATISNGGPSLQGLSTVSNSSGYILGSPSLTDISSAALVAAFGRNIAQPFGTLPNLTGVTTTVGTGVYRGGIVYLKVSGVL